MPAVRQCLHTYANVDLNVPCGSRVMSIFTNSYGRTDGQTHQVIIAHTKGSFNVSRWQCRFSFGQQIVAIEFHRSKFSRLPCTF